MYFNLPTLNLFSSKSVYMFQTEVHVSIQITNDRINRVVTCVTCNGPLDIERAIV